jgi:hypothetical protein
VPLLHDASKLCENLIVDHRSGSGQAILGQRDARRTSRSRHRGGRRIACRPNLSHRMNVLDNNAAISDRKSLDEIDEASVERLQLRQRRLAFDCRQCAPWHCRRGWVPSCPSRHVRSWFAAILAPLRQRIHLAHCSNLPGHRCMRCCWSPEVHGMFGGSAKIWYAAAANHYIASATTLGQLHQCPARIS